MNVTLDKLDDAAVIRLAGRFTFNAHAEFTRCYEAALRAGNARRIEVDLGGVDYLDSSALGMLLVLRDRARGMGLEVALRNCSGTVGEVLEIANFSTLFPIR